MVYTTGIKNHFQLSFLMYCRPYILQPRVTCICLTHMYTYNITKDNDFTLFCTHTFMHYIKQSLSYFFCLSKCSRESQTKHSSLTHTTSYAFIIMLSLLRFPRIIVKHMINLFIFFSFPTQDHGITWEMEFDGDLCSKQPPRGPMEESMVKPPLS